MSENIKEGEGTYELKGSKDQKELVILRIAGDDWGGWTSFEASEQIDAICPQFILGLTERWVQNMAPRPLAAGMPCEIILKGRTGLVGPYIKGYIDKVEHTLGSLEHGITVSGRGKQGDLVDCSAIHSPGSWSGLKATKIIKELCSPFDIKTKYHADIDEGEPFRTFKLEEGETVFEAVDRILKQRELVAIPYLEGDLLITTLGHDKATTRLVQGENVKSGRATYDISDRFSDYIVKGQRQGDDNDYGKTVSQTRGEARDEIIDRYRPLLLRAENQVDGETAVKRAKWEASVRAARSVTISVVLRGWRRENGIIWSVNTLVPVDIPYLRIKQELLVTKVTLSMAYDSGTTVTLELKDPKAFDPEPPKKTKVAGKSGAKGETDLLQASAESAWSAYKESVGQ